MPVSEQAFELLKERLNQVEKSVAVVIEGNKGTAERLGKIENILSRLTWIVISGLGLAFVGWVIGGGLSHVAIS